MSDISEEDRLEIRKYVLKYLKQGISEERIRKSLIKSEIPPLEIDSAFEVVRNYIKRKEQDSKESQKPKSTIIISARIPIELHSDIKNSGYRQNDLIKRALRHYLDRHLKK